jgi:hypothetical protein
MSSDLAPTPSAPRREGPATWDVVATVVELVVLALGGLLMSFAGVFLVMASDSCGAAGTQCSSGVILLGVAIAVVAPWIALLGMGTWAIVRLVQGRSGWWVPLLAVPLAALIFAIGVAITFSAVG